MKKLLTLFALMLVCIGQVFAYDFEVNGIYYNKSGSNATVTYNPLDYNSYSGIVVIPATVTYNDVTYNVTSIGTDAFYSCSGLTFISIPNSVKSIGYGAFSGCSGLTSISIPSSVTSIGYATFAYCSGLTSVTIPNSVKSIGENAFFGCSGLTSVIIPNSVTSIGESAFSDCSGLISITIPNSVTSIGDRAFSGCSGLTSVTIPNSVTSIGGSAFYKCESLTSVNIPTGVTSIGYATFAYCSGLTSVTIPNSVTSIGESAFCACTGLTSVTIPNSVTGIGDCAFSFCYGLTSVTIPNSVTSIGNYAFEYCSGLTSVTIPNNVTSIGSDVFRYCYGLTSITNMAAVPQTINSNTFSNYSGATLHVLEGCKNEYAAANYWKDFIIVDDIPTIKVNAITLNKTVYSCEVGGVIQASVGSYLPTDATIQRVTWSVGDPSIAYVDAKTGQILGLQDGVTTITAMAIGVSGVTATATLKVGEAAKLQIQLNDLIATAEAAYAANNIGNPGADLITANSQFSSNATETSEGSLDNLLDGDLSTFWHSEWMAGSKPMHTHYLQVELTEAISGTIQMTMGRRSNAANDHPVRMTVEYSLDGTEGSFTQASEEMAFEATTGYVTGTFTLPTAAKYLRFFNEESNGSLQRGYWHCSEFQLNKLGASLNEAHSVVADVLAEAIALAKTVEDASVEDIAALQEALDFYRANINRDYQTFADGTTYNNTEETQAEVLAYTRNFKNTNWQALYIPFSLDYEEWKDDFDIAEIHNFIEYDDDENGEFDRTYLVVLRKNSGSTEPNYPYLIRAKETGNKTLTLVNKTLEPAESTSIDCSSVKNRYTFTGTYTPVTDMYANGYYALSGGALNKANSASVVLGAQRWYMEVTSRTGGAASVKAQSIKIVVDGEDETEGIEAPFTSPVGGELLPPHPSISPKGESPVAYDLTGRAVRTAANVRGINISNGKKIIN